MGEVKPRAPAGLGAAGRRLWGALLADDLVFDSRELAVLALAARQADDVARLEEALARDGLVVKGASGQPRLNAAVAELRQARLAVGRLLGLLAIPDEDERPASASTRRAAKAASVRWSRKRAEGERGVWDGEA